MFALLENKLVTIPLAIIAIILAVYSGISYFKIGTLEKKIDALMTENAELDAANKAHRQAVKDSLAQIELTKEQCKILLEYERRKPRRPEATDEDPDPSFIDRLFGGGRLRAPTAPAIDDSDTHGPGNAPRTTRPDPNIRNYPIKVRPESPQYKR